MIAVTLSSSPFPELKSLFDFSYTPTGLKGMAETVAYLKKRSGRVGNLL
jgi:hypothetical protein